MEKVYIGKIVGTHGIKGEIRIISNFEFKDKVFLINSPIYIEDEKHIIKTYRKHKNYDMITIDDITDINDVLKYKNKKVYKDKSDISLNEDEVLDSELVKYKVIDKSGKSGIIKEIFYASSTNKIIRCMFDKEVLIPYKDEFIKKMDKKNMVLEVELIDGMM